MGDVAGNINGVGEGQIRITRAAGYNLTLSELPAKGSMDRWVSNSDRWIWKISLTD